ncbi:autoinducer binding domain-containing protein [Sulfitobacter porphyrae]|uniref:Autoinducer binding domain-containing protein n=1 Tax=Sulfitobacter porphyrae TaxID=1246864 RepID=A0ABW2B0B6_9RHOB
MSLADHCRVFPQLWHRDGQLSSGQRRGPSGGRSGFVEDGFPEEWICEYIDSNLHVIDPIPGLAARLSRPFLWSEIEKLANLTEQEADFIRRGRHPTLATGSRFRCLARRGATPISGSGLENRLSRSGPKTPSRCNAWHR